MSYKCLIKKEKVMSYRALFTPYKENHVSAFLTLTKMKMTSMWKSKIQLDDKNK